MNMRIIVSMLLTFASLIVGPPFACAAADAPKQPPTNVIVILADDMGYGDLGCYGHPRFRTPCIDRLAAEGVRLTQFNTPMPFCAPTRAALLTGRYPARCGMNTNPAPDADPRFDAVALADSEVLLPQLFKQAGYATAMVGKWHLGHRRAESRPIKRGFDEYLGILYSNDMRPVELIEGDRAIEYPLVQATLTKRYTERAVDFLERSKDRPFFLYFAHAMPHKPLACSEEFYKKSGAGLYGDAMAELDWSVGQVLDKLRELKLDERTLVVFTSDNGPWYGGSTGGLRGMKSTTWEGGYRVPCIVRWPGHVPAGKTSDGLAVTMDVFATAIKAAGIAPPEGRTLDGRDLLPMLGGERSPHDVLLGQNSEQLVSIRDERFKLYVIAPRAYKPPSGEKWIDPRGPDGVTILAPYEQPTPQDYPGVTTGDAPKAMMLFDLVADPAEQHDVANKNADVVARLKARLDELAKEF